MDQNKMQTSKCQRKKCGKEVNIFMLISEYINGDKKYICPECHREYADILNKYSNAAKNELKGWLG